MTRILVLLGLLIGLSACNSGGTNPFIENQAEADGTAGTTDTTTDTGAPISSDRTLLPGTVNPNSDDTIFRTEARSSDGSDNGNGFAEDFEYDSATDTFTVGNLAFDGEGPYTRVLNPSGQNLGIGPFSVFEAQATAVDGLTSSNINQLVYRALYAIGPDGETSIAIVRSGAFINFGFGGYIYQRNGSVVLPETGQAIYNGTANYGGLRDFEGQGGIEYVTGDMFVQIDFNDFNEGAGVVGVVSNRRVYDMDQNDITANLLPGLGGGTQLPPLRFKIEPGVLDANGELTGTIESVNTNDGEVFETGQYFAVLSGPNARNITGIVVVTGEDPRDDQVTFRETAGFFATRQ